MLLRIPSGRVSYHARREFERGVFYAAYFLTLAQRVPLLRGKIARPK